jgi:hypothetical protein
MARTIETNMVLDKFLNSSQQSISSLSPKTLIEQYQSLKERLETQVYELKKDFETLPQKYRLSGQCVPKLPQWTSQIIPPYETFSCMVPKFNHCILKAKETFYSDSFKLSGLSWRIKAYIWNDELTAVDSKYLSVFIELLNGLPYAQEYDYKIDLVCYPFLQVFMKPFKSN